MRLLLDSHLPTTLAKQLRRHGVDVVVLSEWIIGRYDTAPDRQILRAAYADGRILITYDCQTVPSLLMEWAEVSEHHAGVILVDDKTIQPDDVGRLLRAILKLVESRGDEDWQDRVIYLERP